MESNKLSAMKVKQAIYNVVHPVLRVLRNNRFVIRRIFDVKIPAGVAVQFDPTTVLLKDALRQICTDQDKNVLEIGIGQGALVSLSLAARKPVQITGVDCSTSRVASSQKVADYNNINVNFLLSDLFSALPENARFDLIFFNPPYVPTQIGTDLKLTKRLEVDGDQMWDGGEDGTSVLREFLNQGAAFLSPQGRIVFGVQNMFVPDDLVLKVLEVCRMQLLQRVKRRMVPSCVYVVQPLISENASSVS